MGFADIQTQVLLYNQLKEFSFLRKREDHGESDDKKRFEEEVKKIFLFQRKLF